MRQFIGRLPTTALTGLIIALLTLGARSPTEAAPSAEPLGASLVSIVWPHDAQGNPTSPAGSRLVNVSIWPSDQVSCAPGLGSGAYATLYAAKDNDPLQPVPGHGQLTLRTIQGVTFLTDEYNDVPADLADDPTAHYVFTTWNGNVWVHAADPRTRYPNPVLPTGYASVAPGSVLDSRIQVVWPHDAQGRFAPVDRATFVNIAVDLFAHGTLKSVPPNFHPYDSFGPLLSIAVGNGPIGANPSPVRPEKTTYDANGIVFPRWVFNNVPVDPSQQYHFLISVSTDLKKASRYTTVWTHAADPRTVLPNPQPPPPCVP